MNTSLQLIPDQASTTAARTDALFLFILAVSVFFTLLIAGLVIYFSLRYRRKSPDERPKPILGSLKLELAWTFLPLALVMIMFSWGAIIFFSNSRPPADAMEIYVIGKQWMWKFQHPEGPREINTLHVPVNRPVKLLMTSEDVIHDLFIPAFRIKHDVVPGRMLTQWFTATKVGEYHLFCSQYCGMQHANMNGKVIVMEEADYQKWLTGAETGSSAADAGEKLFLKYGCALCHSSRAPTMAGLFASTVKLADGSTVKADESYLRQSILQPRAQVVAGYSADLMPSFAGQLSEEQIMQLLAYIKSQKEVAATSQAANNSQKEGDSPSQAVSNSQKEGDSPSQAVSNSQKEGDSPSQAVSNSQKEGASPSQSVVKSQKEVASPSPAVSKSQKEVAATSPAATGNESP